MALNFEMKPDRLYLVPLGGCGMFGANATLYGYRGKWIMVDLGMGFADDSTPGVEILLPDVTFAEELGDDLLGILITHAHEDHIGAIPYLWSRLKKPIYGSKFTLERIRQSVGEMPWGANVSLKRLEPRQEIQIGAFKIKSISVAHSIPESMSFAITVDGVGTLLHTGDWKIDPQPVETDLIDKESFQELGNNGGVIAVVGDSTNADALGEGEHTEQSVQDSLVKLFKTIKGAIGITCFSTNVARMHSVAVAAQACGRKVCLVGRSLKNIEEAARNCGYLKGIDEFIDVEEAEDLKDSDTVYLCTGSQGENRSALARIAAEDHSKVKFGKNTTMIFSSRTIPGNERSVENIKNNLCRLGVKVMTEQDWHVHVSGHPYPSDLKELYSWVKPHSLVAVHGEAVQLEKHVECAKQCGIDETFIPENGEVIEISSQGKLTSVESVQAGVMAVEGEGRIVPIQHEAILMRRRLMNNGSVVVTVVLDERGKIVTEPIITAMGLMDDESDEDCQILREAIEEVVEAIRITPKNMRDDDEAMAEEIRIAARTFFRERFDRNPQTRVHLVRV